MDNLDSSKNRSLSAELSFLLGLVLAISGFFAFIYPAKTGHTFLFILSAMLFTTSLVFFRLATSLRRNPRYFFVATFLILTAFLLVFHTLDLFALSFRVVWPLLVVNAGLSLFVSSFFAYGHLRKSMLIPSLAFVLMGLLFLLFSFGIFNFSFKNFFLRWWPLILLFSGLLLLLLSFRETKK